MISSAFAILTQSSSTRFSGKYFALLVLLMLPVAAFSQSERALFSPKMDVVMKASAEDYSRMAVVFDEDFRVRPPEVGEILHMPLQDLPISFRVERVSEYMPGVFSFTGIDVDRQDRHLAFSFDGESITGVMQFLPEARIYHFGSDAGMEMDFLAHVRPEMRDILSCGADDNHSRILLASDHPLERGRQNVESLTKSATSFEMPAVFSSMDDDTIIDIMIVYSPAAAQWSINGAADAPGSIGLTIAQAMNLSQQALDNSDVGIELRLVHSYQVDYDELGDDATSASNHLRRLTASSTDNPFGSDFNGYLLDVHTNRNTFGADVVAMFLVISDVGGIGWRPSSYSGAQHFAFSVNRVQQIYRSYTLIHEIGHNVGQDHGRNQNSAAADEFGGIHSYSTGWKFEASGQTHHTVMQYRESSSSSFVDYPGFSNPQQNISGVAAGSTDPSDLADNARSWRDVKSLVANYRATTVNPPQLGSTDNSITISIPQGQTGQVPINLTNTGTGPLRWSAEVGVGTNFTAKTVFDFGSDEILSEGMVLYETGFESSDGFTVGTYNSSNQIRTMDFDAVFSISSDAPSTGSQHLHIGNQPDKNAGQWASVRFPLFDRGENGLYSIEFDAKVLSGDGANFYVDLIDARVNQYSAGFVFYNGRYWALHRTPENTIDYESFGSWTTSPTTYQSFKIFIDTESNSLVYQLNGNTFLTSELLNGYTPDYIIIDQQFSGSASHFLDIDNVKITRYHTGYSWLGFEHSGGVIDPGESGSVILDVSAAGKDLGIYTGSVVIRSNEGPGGTLTVPVELTVTEPLSADVAEIPNRLVLHQNYPNPFNPTTRIGYTIPDNRFVSLEIYDVTGRVVAQLVNEYKTAGQHYVTVDASDWASGIYFYRIQAGGDVLTRKFTLVK